MRILQISNYIQPVIGGIGRVAEDAAHFFSQEQSIEQKILCFNDTPVPEAKDRRYRKTVRETVDGVEVIRCGCFAKLFSQSLSLSLPTVLHRLMKEFRPDVVIFHYPNPYIAHFLLREKLPFRMILWWHSDIVKGRLLCALFHGQNLRLIRRADQIIGATPGHLTRSAYAAAIAEKPTAVVPYTVGEYRIPAPERYAARVREIRAQYEGKLICLFVGRHVPYKGLSCLIRASKLLDERFVILIAGFGPLTEALKQEAGGDEKIRFLGALTDAEKFAFQQACDVFCFPSVTKNENFGLALSESMYFGKPAVTFTIPDSGVNTVCVGGLTGIECPNGSAEAYAAALTELAEDPALLARLGAAARKQIQDSYSDRLFRAALFRAIGLPEQEEPL